MSTSLTTSTSYAGACPVLNHLSLRVKVALLIVLVMLVLTSTASYLVLFFPTRMNDMATRWAESRVAGVANVLARGIAPGLDFDDPASVHEAVAGLAAVNGATYGAVARLNGDLITSWNTPQLPPLVSQKNLKPGFTISDGQLHLVHPVTSPGGNHVFLILGVTLAELDADKAQNRLVGLGLGSLLMVLGIGLSMFIGVALLRPITDLARLTADIVATGDLTRSIAVLGDDELGLLAKSVGAIVAQQRNILARIHTLIGGITEVAQRVSSAGQDVVDGMGSIQRHVEDTSSATRHMLTSLRSIGEDVEALAHNAADSSSSLIQMASSNREVADNTLTMATSAQATSGAVQGMAASVGEIAHNIEQLNATIGETSSSMQRMDRAIEEVERNAKETARLSEQVLSDAETGVGALQKTLQGIDAIKESSSSAATVIGSLGQHISEIGAILQVIDEVAAQTKLLSLNAAIIAAQAGEHGRGFSVVADQIKELAQRTGASTREISGLIHNIQEESRNATVAMNRGVMSVEAGVLLGHEASNALGKITESAHASSAMMRKIAQATLDQTRGTRQVSASIERIAQTVGQISSYSQEQARGAEQITDSSKNMHLLTEQVRRSSEEQAQGSRQVIKAMETITDMVNRLNNAQRDQTGGAELVQSSVDEIRHIAAGQAKKVGELESAIATLAREASVLEAELGKFKV